MFRRICKLASGTQQRADSPLESLIWYRKRFISCSSSSFCRKWGAPLVSQSKDKDTLLVEEWDFPELWSLHPTCHAVQQKKKKKVLKKRMRSYQWESYASVISVMGSLRYYFEVCTCYILMKTLHSFKNDLYYRQPLFLAFVFQKPEFLLSLWKVGRKRRQK